MAASDPQQATGGGGNMLTRKLGPLPTWGWLAIVTVLFAAYYLYQKHKQASSASQGSGASPTTGEAFVPEFVINNDEEPPGGPPAKRPPQPKPKPGGNGGDWKEITVERDQTFAQLARDYHWDSATIRAIQQANQIAGKGQLRPGTTLHKGQVILRPIKDSSGTKDTGNG